ARNGTRSGCRATRPSRRSRRLPRTGARGRLRDRPCSPRTNPRTRARRGPAFRPGRRARDRRLPISAAYAPPPQPAPGWAPRVRRRAISPPSIAAFPHWPCGISPPRLYDLRWGYEQDCSRDQKLMNAPDLERALQREEWDLHIEAFAGRALHMITAGHETGGRLQRHAAGILVAFARRNHGLNADDAGALDLAHAAARIGDVPVACQQLHGLLAPIFDDDVISPEIAVFLRLGLIVQEARRHGDADVAGGCLIHDQSRCSTVTSVFTELAMKQSSWERWCISASSSGETITPSMNRMRGRRVTRATHILPAVFFAMWPTASSS